MIAIILGILTAIILFIQVRKESNQNEDWYSRAGRFVAIFAALAIAFSADAIAFAIYKGNAVESTETTEIVASVELVALKDNSSTTGSFFLGSGSLSNKNYYAFYYETDHGYKYDAIDAESHSNPVYIKYIPIEETPHIDRYSIMERKTMTTDGSKAWLVSIIAWLQYGSYNPGDIISKETTNPALFVLANDPNYYDNWRYEIHIPEGSIKTNYAIDLE